LSVGRPRAGRCAVLTIEPNWSSVVIKKKQCASEYGTVRPLCGLRLVAAEDAGLVSRQVTDNPNKKSTLSSLYALFSVLVAIDLRKFG
jgi:hypothetical protein